MQSVEDSSERTRRDLVRVVQAASAVSLGAVTALLYSVKSVTPHVEFRVTIGTGVAFLLGAALSWLFLRASFVLASRKMEAGTKPARAALVSFVSLFILLLTGTLIAFAYGVKDIGQDKLRDVLIGAIAAVLVLSFFGFLIWRVGRFFQNDH